MIVQNLAV